MAMGFSPVVLGDMDWNTTDSDGDGYSDRAEIEAGYDPIDPKPSKLVKRLLVNLSTQTMTQQLGYLDLDSFKVSAGTVAWPTPIGEFYVKSKSPKAWSKVNKLWLPYWLGFGISPRDKKSTVGVHGLPLLADGKTPFLSKPMGQPDSHGCVRVPDDKAKKLYEWADVGTLVSVRK